ncbi:hypothetical protein FKM82_003314 [Ascaphus truei]
MLKNPSSVIPCGHPYIEEISGATKDIDDPSGSTMNKVFDGKLSVLSTIAKCVYGNHTTVALTRSTAIRSKLWVAWFALQ